MSPGNVSTHRSTFGNSFLAIRMSLFKSPWSIARRQGTPKRTRAPPYSSSAGSVNARRKLAQNAREGEGAERLKRTAGRDRRRSGNGWASANVRRGGRCDAAATPATLAGASRSVDSAGSARSPAAIPLRRAESTRCPRLDPSGSTRLLPRVVDASEPRGSAVGSAPVKRAAFNRMDCAAERSKAALHDGGNKVASSR